MTAPDLVNVDCPNASEFSHTTLPISAAWERPDVISNLVLNYIASNYKSPLTTYELYTKPVLTCEAKRSQNRCKTFARS